MTASPARPARDRPSLLGVVLRRELVRAARRRRTWVMRAGYTGALLAFLLFILEEQLAVAAGDVSWIGSIGRQLFTTYVALQLVAVALFTPLLVASGIQEEREAKTLDLLTLTGVPAGRIVFDQVSSRLWLLFATIAAGLPAVSALNSFGGFSAAEVVNTSYAAAATAVILASFAGFAGLVTRAGPVLPAALCLPYVSVAFGGTWMIQAFPAGYREVGLESPLHAAFSSDPLAPLGAILWVPALVSGWQLTVPVFRILTGGDEHEEGFGLLSQDIWVVERYRTHTILWVLAAGFAIALTLLLADRPLARGLALLAATLFAAAWQRVSMLGVLWLGERLAARQHLTWRLRPRTTRAVFRPIVTWRELFTRAAGPARLVPIALCAMWLLFLVAFLLDDSPIDEGAALLLGSLAGLGGCFVAALGAVATTQDDRRRDTLPLLFLTRLGPADVAWQKALAAVGLAAPLILLGTALWGASTPDPWSTAHEPGYGHELGPNLLPGVVGVPLAAWLCWQLLLVANTALASASGSTLARQPAISWPLGLVSGFVWLFWPVMLVLLLEVSGLEHAFGDLEFLGLTWYPVFSDHALVCELGGVPAALASGLVAQALSLPLWVLFFGNRLASIARGGA